MTKRNGQHDPNVTSLDEARRRAAQKSKQDKQQKPGLNAGGPRTVRSMIVGGVIIAMALCFIASFFVDASQLIGGGGV